MPYITKHKQHTLMGTIKKRSMIDSLEKIPVKIFTNSQQGSVYVAQQIAQLIKEKEAEGKKCVIGLATAGFVRKFDRRQRDFYNVELVSEGIDNNAKRVELALKYRFAQGGTS